MPEVEIDHVQIAAPPGCEDAAREFFAGIVGLAEIEKPEPLRARGGAPVTWDETLPGERRFYAEDPWGNRIEFLAALG
jgi:hypothetical protein